jgi:hypothetical protein
MVAQRRYDTPEPVAEQLNALRDAEAVERVPKKVAWVTANQQALRALGPEADDILGDWHNAILTDGIEDDSVAYFSRMDAALADAREAVTAPSQVETEADAPLALEPTVRHLAEPIPEPPRVELPSIRSPVRPPPAQYFERNIPVSAPVSRENFAWDSGQPQRPSQVRLSKEQIEAAGFSGISAAEYGRQVLRLMEAKKAGRYQERG